MKITQAEVDMIKRIMPGEYGIYRIDGKRVETLGTSPRSTGSTAWSGKNTAC